MTAQGRGWWQGRRARADSGIALLNALVLAAVLAAVAATLMILAGTSRDRQFLMQAQGQGGQYLDALERLSVLILREDMVAGPASDDLTEAWALPRPLAIDRGAATLAIADLQGRFNLNWLADPADLAARAAFARLVRNLGLPPALAQAVADYLRPGAATGDYATRDIPIRPPQAPVALAEEIAAVTGMTPEAFARLRPYVAALPADTRLNVATAPGPVLAAVLAANPPGNEAGNAAGGAEAGPIAALIAARAARPFESVADFLARAQRLTGRAAPRPDDPAAFGPARLGLTSRWFSATLTARLDGAQRVRRLIIRRDPAQGTARIAARLEDLE